MSTGSVITPNPKPGTVLIPELELPMSIRSWGDPFGYVHGQINHEGIKHPGDDLNNGSGAWADYGAPLKAPGDSKIVFAGSAGGWGTLIVGVFAFKLPDYKDGGKLKFMGWRQGHPKDIHVKVGQRVRKGEVIGTCGNGGNGKPGQPGAMAPHDHYDIFIREAFEEYAKRYDPQTLARTGLPWTYWDRAAHPKRDHFAEFFRDPADYHPEIRAAGRRTGRG